MAKTGLAVPGSLLSSDLGWLLDQNAKPLCNQHELGYRCDLHLFHHVPAVGFDCPLRRAQLTRYLFVHLSSSDAFKDLSFARCQAVHELPQRIVLIAPLPHRTAARKCSLD